MSKCKQLKIRYLQQHVFSKGRSREHLVYGDFSNPGRTFLAYAVDVFADGPDQRCIEKILDALQPFVAAFIKHGLNAILKLNQPNLQFFKSGGYDPDSLNSSVL